MSLTVRALILAAIVATSVAGWWRLTAYYERRGYERAQAEYQAAAELQREANRARARQAEEKHAAQSEVRERFIVTTIKEIEHVAAPLASCPVPEPVRLRINAAAACARGDRPSACGPADPVPNP